jgi:pimeloyl-ACP methyl ester carboxylesterase
VNELQFLNARSDSPFAGKLDMSAVALAGHSMGGLSALLGIERDQRFRAGIIIDGDVPDALVSETQTPVLVLAAGREVWSDDESRLWANLRGPRLAVNLKGAEHLTPSDAVWLPVFQVDVVPATGPPPGGFFHHPYANFIAYCSCESTRDELNTSIGTLAYPEAGKCVEIGKCARCCRISLP